jgi:hypothetical protein
VYFSLRLFVFSFSFFDIQAQMTAFDTETALIHKQGILQILVMNKDRGPEFRALAGLVNL